MTRSELHQAILDGSIAIEDVTIKELRNLKEDFDMAYAPDFEAWCVIWVELDKREFKNKKTLASQKATQDDVNRMHEAFKNRKTRIKKDFY